MLNFVSFFGQKSIIKILCLNKTLNSFFSQQPIFQTIFFKNKCLQISKEYEKCLQKLNYFKEESEKHTQQAKKFTIYKRLFLREKTNGFFDLEQSILKVFEMFEKKSSSQNQPQLDNASNSFFGKLKSRINNFTPSEIVLINRTTI